MIDFFDRIYSSIEDKNKLLKFIRYYSFIRFIVRSIANIILPTYFAFTKNIHNYSITKSDKNEGRIIVSLTSFPARINRVWLVIETILRQTNKPDKIILWLSKDQFSSIDFLPIKLLNQKNRGLEIELVEGNLKSYKKYFYSLIKYPNDNILTIDDDIFYKSTMIEELKKFAYRFPNNVISTYCSEMVWVDKKLSPYILWSSVIKEMDPNFNLFFGSGGGTYFPPKSLHADAINKELFLKLAPTADDVWLNAMCRLNKIKIAKGGNGFPKLPVFFKDNLKLNSINNDLGQNDIQINNVRNYYQENYGVDLFDEYL